MSDDRVLFRLLTLKCVCDIIPYSHTIYLCQGEAALQCLRQMFLSKNIDFPPLTFSNHRVPTGNYMFKVNDRNTRSKCEICSKLTIKTPERSHSRRSGVFIVNSEHISHLVLVFLLLTLSRQMPTGILSRSVF